MVPFSPTRPPHATADPAVTTIVTSVSATKQMTRRMGSLPVEPAPDGAVQGDQTDAGGARFPDVSSVQRGCVTRARDARSSDATWEGGRSSYRARMSEVHARVDRRVVDALDELARTSG